MVSKLPISQTFRVGLGVTPYVFLLFFWKYYMLWNLIRTSSFGGISNESQNISFVENNPYFFSKFGFLTTVRAYFVWTKLRGVTTHLLYTVYSTPLVLRCLLFSVFIINLNYITRTMGILTSLNREIHRNVRNSEL